MIYNIVTAEQLLISVGCFFLISALTGIHRKMSLATTIWVCLLLFFIGLDQLWWTLARSAFEGAEWVMFFSPLMGGMDAKIWFETSAYVLVFKSGILISLIGLIYQAITEE